MTPEERKKFIEFLEWASRVVKTWPEWKRNVLQNAGKAQNDTPRKVRGHDAYIDERYCGHCDRYTQHTCYDSNHERDSSGDFQQCEVCNWYMSGYTRKYEPPYGD